MIDCKKLAKDIKNNIKQQINGRFISMTVIQIGDNPESNSYIKGKKNDCEEVGIKCNHIKFDEDCTTYDVLKCISKYNHDEHCNGIIMQLPVPKHIDVNAIINEISMEKDIDGFKQGSIFVPCTPKGILEILEYIGENVDGKNVVIIGRGKLVGRPLIDLLINKNATVTCCHSHTKNLKSHTSNADIIISATGVKGLINKDMVRPEQVIIDAGISVVDGKLYGDCEKDLYDYVDKITTTPGGVGILTRVALLQNTTKFI